MFKYIYVEPKDNKHKNVVLLDRDGTVIIDPPDERVTSVQKIKLFPDTIEALRLLAGAGFAVILITNQAAIPEGRITVQEFEQIHSAVLERLKESGVTVLATYICSHSPVDGCDCRKPKPGMLLEAISDFGLEPKNLYMVGDRQSDVLAGVNAGVKGILVETANHKNVAPEAVHSAPTLTDAINYVVSH